MEALENELLSTRRQIKEIEDQLIPLRVQNAEFEPAFSNIG
jgi:hypothetical protein